MHIYVNIFIEFTELYVSIISDTILHLNLVTDALASSFLSNYLFPRLSVS